MNSAEVFEIVFLLFFIGNFVLKYYLDRRQVRSIQINRGAVPAAFAGKITLEAHQKAADYSVERIKFGQLARITDLGFVLIATIGGLIQWIYGEVSGWLGGDIWAQIVIILCYGFLSSLIDLPFSWYSTFKIEAKYGFNTTTPARFIKDLLLSAVLSLVLGIPILAAVLWFGMLQGTFGGSGLGLLIFSSFLPCSGFTRRLSLRSSTNSRLCLTENSKLVWRVYSKESALPLKASM